MRNIRLLKPFHRPGRDKSEPAHAGRTLRSAVDLVVAAALFVVCQQQYRTATGMPQLCDSTYSVVVAEKLLKHGTVRLTDCVPADPAERRGMAGYIPEADLPYHFAVRPDPHDPAGRPAVFYGYPLGSTVLSLPAVAYYTSGRRAVSTLNPDGTPNGYWEGIVQVKIGSMVAAGIVGLFYLIARFYCPVVPSLLVAVGFAFASPVYSTLCRSLWSHTWMVALLSAAIVLLLAARTRENPSRWSDLRYGLALGTLFFWIVFTRQHGVLSCAAVGAYLLVRHRRMLPGTILAGATWVAALVAVSWHVFGSPLPPSVYSAGSIDGRDVWQRFGGLMASPSRGLLVFCPYLAVVGWLLVGYRRQVESGGLLLPAGLAVVAHTAVFSCYNGWHAGSSYGPRYFCDVLPWFVVAAAVGLRALGRAEAAGFPLRKAVELAALLVAVGWGGFVHSRGANSMQAWEWNGIAARVPEADAVRDWRHPQFLCGITFAVTPDGRIVEKQ